MKTACVLTTINVPTVLKLYRFCGSDVKIFVAHDIKTPTEAYKLIEEIGAEISTGADYSCSDLIGFNSIQRRNVAFLDALKWGAEIIVSIDDDNVPAGLSYFSHHEIALERPFAGLMFEGSPGAWFDPGYLLEPCAKHRGIPHDAVRHGRMVPTVGARVGVSAGLCLGDPDIDAVTRIATHPIVGDANALGIAGVAVSPATWTVFNSQNTAVLREFVPAWGMVPFVGRFDDIYASLVVQRVMRDRGYHVRFGQPLVWQSRNEHDLLKDLRAEIDGYETIRPLAALLDALLLPNRSVIGDCRMIWDAIEAANLLPDARTISAMMAYLDDAERVMG